jgi:hypothetical protein
VDGRDTAIHFEPLSRALRSYGILRINNLLMKILPSPPIIAGDPKLDDSLKRSRMIWGCKNSIHTEKTLPHEIAISNL